MIKTAIQVGCDGLGLLHAFRLIGLLIFMCGSLWAEPLVPNGSFETNTTDGGITYQTLYPGFAGLPGWTFGDAPEPVLIGSPDTNYPYATPYGMWQVDLTGSANISGGWIETVVTGLPTTGTYRIDFDLGTSTNWLGAGTSAPSVMVSVTDNAPQIVSHMPTSNNERTTCSTTFAAPSNGMSTLRFSNLSEDGIGWLAIDNVSAIDLMHPSVTIQNNGGTCQIVYTGTLDESADLLGWTEITAATNPYTVPLVSPKCFYRSRTE